MPPYLNYPADLITGRAGDFFDSAVAKDDISLINAAPQAAQVTTIAVTAANATTYTVTLNGVAVTYTSDADATQAEIVQGLRAAIYADGALSGIIAAAPDGAGTSLVLTSRIIGESFTAGVGANLVASATTAAADAVGVPFGAAVAFDPTRHQGGLRLATGNGGTAGFITLTPAVANTTDYRVVFLGSDGQLVEANYTSDADATAAEIVAGLIADAGTIPGITLSGTTTLIATIALGSGASVEDWSENLSAVETAPVGALRFAGIALREDTQELGGLVDGYLPNSTMSVCRLGRVRVATEEAVTPGAPAYVRLDDGLGTKYRSTPAAGCARVPGAHWYQAEGSTLGIIQLSGAPA